jgi:hypothetical protein
MGSLVAADFCCAGSQINGTSIDISVKPGLSFSVVDRFIPSKPKDAPHLQFEQCSKRKLWGRKSKKCNSGKHHARA